MQFTVLNHLHKHSPSQWHLVELQSHHLLERHDLCCQRYWPARKSEKYILKKYYKIFGNHRPTIDQNHTTKHKHTWVSLKSFTPTQYTEAPRLRERLAWGKQSRNTLDTCKLSPVNCFIHRSCFWHCLVKLNTYEEDAGQLWSLDPE